MNEHVLLAMKYLDDNNSVTRKELLDNYIDAVGTSDDADADGADACTNAAYVYIYAIAAAYAADAAYAGDIDCTKSTIDRYFNITGENKQDYINEITKNKGEE